MADVDEVLEFIDTQRIGPEADRVKTFAYAVLKNPASTRRSSCRAR